MLYDWAQIYARILPLVVSLSSLSGSTIQAVVHNVQELFVHPGFRVLITLRKMRTAADWSYYIWKLSRWTDEG